MRSRPHPRPAPRATTLLPLLLLTSLAVASPAAAQTPESFGYRSVAGVLGQRPLLTILLRYSDVEFAAAHDAEYYRQLLFGTPARRVPNLAGEGGYFEQNSYGHFRFVDAGVLGPFTHPDDPRTAPDESQVEAAWGRVPGSSGVGESTPGNEDTKRLSVLARALEAADRSGFDFSRYDRDGDRVIRYDELVVLVIFASPRGPAGGGVRSSEPACVSVRNGYRVCQGMPHAGETVDAATLAHELSHAIGYGIEHYGATIVNANYSIMAAVHPTLTDGRNIVHHDPLVKIRLGWLRPGVVGLARGTRRDLVLRASELPWRDGAEQAWILYDPARGIDEFFILEHRVSRSGGAGTLPLYSWYSPSRGDNFLTTDPAWAGVQGQTRPPDYGFVGVEGYLDPLAAHGLGSRFVHSWYSPSRGDNFATADPAWEGRAGATRSPDYRYVRAEGSLSASAPPFAVALHSWYSPSRGDNFTTADPAWAGAPGDRRPPDYEFVRSEGFVSLLPPVNYDGDPWSSGSPAMRDQGLAIWHVKLDSVMDPMIRPALYLAGGLDRAIYIVPPRGRLGEPGANGLWEAGDGEAALRWLDGSDSGIRVRVTSDVAAPNLGVVVSNSLSRAPGLPERSVPGHPSP